MGEMMISEKARREAENFLDNEKQFHLGMLPTEQSNPKTRDLDKKFAAGPEKGVKMLLSVDRDVQQMAQKVFKGDGFRKMVDASVQAVSGGKKIIFSGCGATGRRSILLEAMWRCFFRDMHMKRPDLVVIGMDSVDVVDSNLSYLRNFKPMDPAKMKALVQNLNPFYNYENLPWMQPGYTDGNWA